MQKCQCGGYVIAHDLSFFATRCYTSCFQIIHVGIYTNILAPYSKTLIEKTLQGHFQVMFKFIHLCVSLIASHHVSSRHTLNCTCTCLPNIGCCLSSFENASAHQSIRPFVHSAAHSSVPTFPYKATVYNIMPATNQLTRPNQTDKPSERPIDPSN